MRTPVVLLAVSVGVVLADSSVVTIALPDILARYHVEISTLAWVLTAFNLALALSRRCRLPSSRVAGPRTSSESGSSSWRPLRSRAASLPRSECSSRAGLVQGVAGAAVVCAALDLLSQAAGTDARAARIWTLAGIVGAALGPAVGGILTQFLGWESIFFVQAPVVLLALVGLRGARPVPFPSRLNDRTYGANIALLLVSGGLRGRAVFARDPAHQRLAARPTAGGPRSHRHADRRDRGRALRADDHAAVGARTVRA